MGDAVGLLLSYGCTLGLEEVGSVTRLQMGLPAFMNEFSDPSMSKGIQLKENESAVIPERALMMLRMASLGSMEDLLAAVNAGYLKTSDGSATVSSPTVPVEQLTKWRNSEKR